MSCSECRDLWHVFERVNTRFNQALHAAFYRISTEIAAHEFVELQRAKNDLQEHQLACPWACLVEELTGNDKIVETFGVRYAFAAGEC